MKTRWLWMFVSVSMLISVGSCARQGPCTSVKDRPQFCCPVGTRIAGNQPPDGQDLYCEKDALRHGPFWQWFDSGEFRAEGTYQEGKLHGPRTLWHKNGQKHLLITFVEGLEQGPFQEWSEKGTQTVEGGYLDGQRHGPETIWHSNGQLKSTGTYDKGNRQGPWTEWYETGVKKAELIYDRGQRKGREAAWWEDGSLRFEIDHPAPER